MSHESGKWDSKIAQAAERWEAGIRSSAWKWDAAIVGGFADEWLAFVAGLPTTDDPSSMSP